MPAPGCRYTLFDDSFAVRGVDGRAERRRLAGADDLGAVLSRHFALDLPRADLEALAARLAARAAAADPFEANSPAG
jgi:arylamine N-acetyltransferase